MDATEGQPARFEFTRRRLDPATGEIELGYAWAGLDGGRREFRERFGLGAPVEVSRARAPALAAALDLLHWMAGVSYWKLRCAGAVGFSGSLPDVAQAGALETLYRDGLAELAWRNGLEHRWWPRFPAATAASGSAGPAGLARRVLVPLGGGKDSLVALERLRAAGHEPETVQVGAAPLIGAVARAAGTCHRVISRRLDPQLAELNARGALNGHVPITAINAAVLVVAALAWDFDAIAFANERSADTPTLTAPDGAPVNHQFAKSHAFEGLLGDWVRRAVAADLEVFSLLRRDRELAVCREFVRHERYFDVFSSCNRNFHLDGPRTRRWCGHCPKCLFVFLGLAPFLDPARLASIFGTNLLDRAALVPDFAALAALDGPRPFECVGEADEVRSALRHLAAAPAWREGAVVAALAPRLAGLDVPALEGLLSPGGPHRIPARFRT